MNEINLEETLIASKSRRFLVFLFDYILIQSIIIFYTLRSEDITFMDYFEKDITIYDYLLEIILISFYGIITYPFFSGTLGHRILGLKIINSNTNNDFNKIYEGYFRELLKNISILTIIPNLWILFDKKNQNIYDKLFHTLVVKRK